MQIQPLPLCEYCLCVERNHLGSGVPAGAPSVSCSAGGFTTLKTISGVMPNQLGCRPSDALIACSAVSTPLVRSPPDQPETSGGLASSGYASSMYMIFHRPDIVPPCFKARSPAGMTRSEGRNDDHRKPSPVRNWA